MAHEYLKLAQKHLETAERYVDKSSRLLIYAIIFGVLALAINIVTLLKEWTQ